MMWKDLSYEWQVAFEEAWTAFCHGCIPIGAALFDENGELVIRDRNRSEEAGTINRRTSHAEANVLHQLETDRYPNIKKMKLYTTMEPCPMCMGTIVMGNIRDVSYAARDAYCGAIHLLKMDPFMGSKNTKCQYIGGELELVQITLQSYHEMKRIEKGHPEIVLEDFGKTSPKAVSIAKKLYEDRCLDEWNGKKEASEVFDAILRSN